MTKFILEWHKGTLEESKFFAQTRHVSIINSVFVSEIRRQLAKE